MERASCCCERARAASLTPTLQIGTIRALRPCQLGGGLLIRVIRLRPADVQQRSLPQDELVLGRDGHPQARRERGIRLNVTRSRARAARRTRCRAEASPMATNQPPAASPASPAAGPHAPALAVLAAVRARWASTGRPPSAHRGRPSPAATGGGYAWDPRGPT